MNVLALDTETELITRTCKAPRLVCVSFADQACADLFKWNWSWAWEWIRELFCGPRIIVGQNIAYDMAVLATQWPELLPLIFEAYAQDRITDTMLRQKLIDIAHGELDHPRHRVGKGCYSLEALAKRHLGNQLDKDTWRLRYGELRDVPLAEWPEGARQYPVDDAVSTLAVYEKQEEWAPLLADQWRQARHAFWLHLMVCWGIATDVERVAELEAMITRDLADVTTRLLAEGLLKPKSKKPDAELQRDTKVAKMYMVAASGLGDAPDDQLEEIVEAIEDGSYPAERGDFVIKLTETGRISLDDEACRATRDPLLIAYAEYTHLAGVLNKDVAALRSGEIHARINSLLETGRISASGNAEDGGYNITNPARSGGIRLCMVPRPGWWFVDSDYDGLELRTMSQSCLELVGMSTMADVLNAGQDPHIMLAGKLLEPQCDYDTTRKRIKAGDPLAKEARQFAKIGNFGLAGGMGVATLVEYAKNNGIQIDEDKARDIREAWLETWPEFQHYFARAGAMCEDGQEACVEQLFSGRHRGGLYFSQLCNTYFQGLGADAAKAAGWAITRACYDSTLGNILHGCRVVNFVHDQFLVEVPADEWAHARAQEVARIMVQEANKWLVDVPATTTPCLATCWSKDAEAIYDDNGFLTPWNWQGHLVGRLCNWLGGVARSLQMREAA